MRVFLTGATGYVGSAILTELIRSRYEVTCLIRPGSEKNLPVYPSDRVTLVYGDLLNRPNLKEPLQECEAVIHLVGIIRENPKLGIDFKTSHVTASHTMIEAAKSTGVKRFLHMSALGAHVGAVSPYQDTKGQAEELVKSSGLNWTIFRPSVIFGPDDQFVNMLAELIKHTPLVPVPGSGNYKLQPVGLANVVQGFVRSLANEDSFRQVYEIGGPRAYSYNQMLDIIGDAIGKRKVRKLHISLPLLKPIVSWMQRYSFFPLTPAQLLMLQEGSTCNPASFYTTFQIDPIPFPEGIRAYLKKPSTR